MIDPANEIHPQQNSNSDEILSPDSQPSPFSFPKNTAKETEEDKRTIYQRQRSSSMDEMNPNRKYGNTIDTLASIPESRPTSSATETNKTPSAKKNLPTKKPTKVKVWIGRCLLAAITIGSICMISAISANTKNPNSWPWGFWYVFALLFDLGLFQPAITMVKFILFFKHIHNPFKGKYKAIPRAIIGADILAVVESKLSLINN